jgi:hypothetical protein
VPLRQSSKFDREQVPPGAMEPIRPRQEVRASIALPRQAGEAAFFGLRSWFEQDSCKLKTQAS